MDWQNLLAPEDFRNLLIGVFGGVIVILLQVVFSYAIVPIFMGKRQNLPNFNHTVWNGSSDDSKKNGQSKSVLKIRQIGNRITAEVQRDTLQGKRLFRYKGRMYGNQIVLEFFDERGPGLIVGTMVLHIGSDLKTLRGASTYFHHDQGRVVSSFRTYRLAEK